MAINSRALVEFALAMRLVQIPPREHQALGGEDIFDVSQLGLKLALGAVEDAAGTERHFIATIAAVLVDGLRRRGLLRRDSAVDLFAESAARVFATEVYPIVDEIRSTSHARQVALATYGYTFRRDVSGGK